MTSGQAKRVEIAKEDTTIIDGAGDHKTIEARVKAIARADRGSTSDLRPREAAERVASWLAAWPSSRLGARDANVEMKGKARVEDALHATRAAVEEGIGRRWRVALTAPSSHQQAEKATTRPGSRHQDRAARDGKSRCA